MIYLTSNYWVNTDSEGKQIRIFRYGDSLDGVAPTDIDRLINLGAAKDSESTDDIFDIIMDNEDSGDTEEVTPVDKKEIPELPPRTAPIAKWKEVATELGIKVTGLKKTEIIAQVYSLLEM